MREVTYLIKEQPKNAAAYNRVRMLVEGLNNNGVIANIFFIPKINNSIIMYHIRYIFLLIRCFFALCFSSREKALILYGEDSLLKYLVKIHRRGLLLVERTEYSTYLYDNSLTSEHIFSIKKFEDSLGLVDGMIVCSYALRDYYSQFCNKPISIIPLVYEEGFIKHKEKNDNHTIVYCGDMGGGKDGVDILIRSFALFNKSIPGYKLFLIGGASNQSFVDNLKALSQELGINDSVVFTGWVDRKDLPDYLEESSLLVLARPANKQAEGGIPSKLAEYLSTGRPVLVTNVGELHKYFTHSVDIFFATPGSIEDFSEKMISVFTHYDKSCIVGKKGQEAVRQFEKNQQSSVLIDYLNSIIA